MYLVEEPGAELLRIGVPFGVEAQAHVRVDADAKVVVPGIDQLISV